MKSLTIKLLAVLGLLFVCLHWAGAALRVESFDQEPPNWEGINNRNTNFPIRTVVQNFGYSPATSHAGGQPGEVGGTINPAGEPAYYGYRLPKPLTLENPSSASGKLFVAEGHGHFLLGFFNADTLGSWRTPNTLVVRIIMRGQNFHCHLEYCTGRWRSGAGVIGGLAGKRISPKPLPCGKVYEWHMKYDPNAVDGNGLVTLTLNGERASCTVPAQHRADGALFTHFGLLPVLKAWDNPGEAWLDDLTINGRQFDFTTDPGWEGLGNRRTYQTKDTRPRFDFGWSPTHFAGGKHAGELGGLIFRGDCRDSRRLAAYGDRIFGLSLDHPLYATGKVSMLRGVSDSTASIGFYNSISSLQKNPAQDQSIPMDYLGINIEGPSSEGFFFYPVYRTHDQIAGALSSRASRPPRIYPDGRPHDWSLKYDPAAANGAGEITVTLDQQTCSLQLHPTARRTGASFDRFGICTPWIDGNSVTVYFDDLQYTSGAE